VRRAPAARHFRRSPTAIALAVTVAAAQAQALDARPLPLGGTRVAASADECAVWQRERAFARSVEVHDAAAFASFLHAGTVFNAGTADAERDRDAVAQSWADIVAGKDIALRWRPGIVSIGGEPTIAVSRGPYILQRLQGGAPIFRVGLFQTVWVKDGRDGVWRVLFDGPASASQPMDDRAAADRWVEGQAMSECASP